MLVHTQLEDVCAPLPTLNPSTHPVGAGGAGQPLLWHWRPSRDLEGSASLIPANLRGQFLKHPRTCAGRGCHLHRGSGSGTQTPDQVTGSYDKL